MTYLVLDLVFLAIAAAVVVAAVVFRRARRASLVRLAPAMAVTAAVTVALTAVFDNVMIASGLFSYDSRRLLGVFVGLVPVEDFAYPLAAAILLPSLWVLLHQKRDASHG